jgi:hypothetical protein
MEAQALSMLSIGGGSTLLVSEGEISIFTTHENAPLRVFGRCAWDGTVDRCALSCITADAVSLRPFYS